MMSTMKQLCLLLIISSLLLLPSVSLASSLGYVVEEQTTTLKTAKEAKANLNAVKKKSKQQALKYESVNINVASVEELMHSLKGIGKKKAQAIVDYRKKHGEFKLADDLLNIKGIGKKLLKKNISRIRLTGDSTL